MDQIWKNIVGLDLKSVSNKFAAKKSWWWKLVNKPARIESEYRQFLYLLATNPEKPLAPWSAELDEFWRQHLLDTRKYAADCNAILGRLIQYHRPMSNGIAAHFEAFAETRKLYLAAFGESARKRRRAEGGPDLGSDIVVFSEHGRSLAHSHHGHNSWGQHHGAGHHAGDHAGSHHSCGGHSHSCGGHSGCGGHGH